MDYQTQVDNLLVVIKAKIYKNRSSIPYLHNYNRQITKLHTFKMIEETVRVYVLCVSSNSQKRWQHNHTDHMDIALHHVYSLYASSDFENM